MDEIAFSAKYKNWIVIKKMSIDENTKEPEVAHILSGIRETIDRKAFELNGINMVKIDEYVATITKGRRKGYSSLVEIFGNLKQNEVRELLLASSSKQTLPLAEAYFIRRLITALGYGLDVTTETLAKMYPELKLPKPKGRFAKG